MGFFGRSRKGTTALAVQMGYTPASYSLFTCCIFSDITQYGGAMIAACTPGALLTLVPIIWHKLFVNSGRARLSLSASTDGDWCSLTVTIIEVDEQMTGCDFKPQTPRRGLQSTSGISAYWSVAYSPKCRIRIWQCSGSPTATERRPMMAKIRCS